MNEITIKDSTVNIYSEAGSKGEKHKSNKNFCVYCGSDNIKKSEFDPVPAWNSNTQTNIEPMQHQDFVCNSCGNQFPVFVGNGE